MPDNSKDGVKITRRFAGRVANVVNAWERQAGNSPAFLGGGVPNVVWTIRALSASAISAATDFLHPGSGQAQKYRYEDGEWVEDGDPVDVLNQYKAGIEINTPIFLTWASGQLFVISADCDPDAGG